MTNIDFIKAKINEIPTGHPILVSRLAQDLAQEMHMEHRKAALATAVAIKRIMDANELHDLRRYQKGIYYRTETTAFGEMGINKELLIAEKYLLPDIGYEAGPAVFHQLGLTTQMPNERVLVTNKAIDSIRRDAKLDVLIRPPKEKVTAANKEYLQMLDILDHLERVPVDAEAPYRILADHIHRQNLCYEMLLAIADQYYGQRVVLQIAHTARASMQD